MRSSIMITPDHFDVTKTQPRFIGYLRHSGVRVGDVVKTYEYMAWASRLCEGHKQARNTWRGYKLGYSSLTADQHEEIDSRCLGLTIGEEIGWEQ